MGVGVMQTKNEVLLEQSAYTKALLSRFGMDKANSVATPVDVNADLVTTSDEVEECDKDLCQSAVEDDNAQRSRTDLRGQTRHRVLSCRTTSTKKIQQWSQSNSQSKTENSEDGGEGEDDPGTRYRRTFG
ncbi:hypothetical protein FHG87_025175 [Trinorchestia longiramus]|nr:hypothetical protein FHG87_025175 [Trinorchestia longiramus]